MSFRTRSYRLRNLESLEDRRLLVVYPTVVIQTNVGDLTLEMYADTAPQTVNNFLNYVHDGDYQNAIFHRVVRDFVVQGGGFRSSEEVVCNCLLTGFTMDQVNPGQFTEIPTDPPVVNEFRRSNVRGTVAMAKLGGNPNSATNQFFVNLVDNSGNLDNQNGGFTVFAGIVNMATVETLAKGPTLDLSQAFPGTSRLRALQSVAVFESRETQRINVVRMQSFRGTSVIEGRVFLDLDRDGRLDPDEGGMKQVTVFADSNGNRLLDDGEPQTTSDINGRYALVTPGGAFTIRTQAMNEFEFTGSGTDGGIAVNTRFGEKVSEIHLGLSYIGRSWTNPHQATDVNAINGVTPIDALLVINELTNRAFSDPRTGSLPRQETPPGIPQFLDVNGDRLVTPLDALLVINDLPRAAASTATTWDAEPTDLTAAQYPEAFYSLHAVGTHPESRCSIRDGRSLTRQPSIAEQVFAEAGPDHEHWWW